MSFEMAFMGILNQGFLGSRPDPKNVTSRARLNGVPFFLRENGADAGVIPLPRIVPEAVSGDAS